MVERNGRDSSAKLEMGESTTEGAKVTVGWGWLVFIAETTIMNFINIFITFVSTAVFTGVSKLA